ncbi:Spc24 subunit of Ndc80-domain-containing protein [Kalaharituber pfeilii]|nr:Spc24 subunit of Ndc80-domain-containing protein [Kalaharituber pfeilii]
MVILDEDLGVLIESTVQNFNIKSDIQSLERANEHLQAITKTRTAAVDESRNNLIALSRKLELAKSTTSSLLKSHAAKDHSATMLALDREKFTLAKNINELESTTHTLEGKLQQLKEELEMVDNEDPLSDPKVVAEDEILLKLKVYRSLGIDVEQDDQVPGVFTKAVVRNPAKGDVHVVKIESRFSRYFYANYFWGVL